MFSIYGRCGMQLSVKTRLWLGYGSIFILILLEKGQKVGLLEQFFLALFQLALFVLKSLADSFRRGEGSFLALALFLLLIRL